MHSHIESRCKLLFNESIKSKYTKKNYESHLKQFGQFIQIENMDELLKIPIDDLQRLLENYLIHLKCITNPNNIPSKFQGIRHFCIMNRIVVDWGILYKMFPQKQKTHNFRSYTADEIKKMLENIHNLRNRALIHFLASTGARIGVFDHQLSIKHMKNMPDSCIAVKLYAGHVEEYWSFLTPQASKALRTYHQHCQKTIDMLNANTPIFALSNFSNKQLGWSGARSIIYRIVSKNIVTRNQHGNRYDVQINHGFRKRFNTILKLNGTVNYNIAEKLMGHKNGLDNVYFTPTINELFNEFRKAINEIEI